MLFIFSTLLCLQLLCVVNATVRYISPFGSGSACTQADPCQTVQEAYDAMPGNGSARTVVLLAGAYSALQGNMITVNGPTSFTLQGAKGAHVELSCGGTDGMQINTTAAIYFQDLTLSSCPMGIFNPLVLNTAIFLNKVTIQASAIGVAIPALSGMSFTATQSIFVDTGVPANQNILIGSSSSSIPAGGGAPSVTLNRCHFQGSSRAYNIQTIGSDSFKLSVSYSTSHNPAAFYWQGNTMGMKLPRAHFAHNLIIGPSNYGLNIAQSQSVLVKNMTIDGNNVGGAVQCIVASAGGELLATDLTIKNCISTYSGAGMAFIGPANGGAGCGLGGGLWCESGATVNIEQVEVSNNQASTCPSGYCTAACTFYAKGVSGANNTGGSCPQTNRCPGFPYGKTK